jgi:Fibronectin type III domain./Fibrobacter succinogenes major domain (Fib_succ_major).
LTIGESNIINNGTALYNNNTSDIVSAESNYWGHSSGPYHPTQNTSGQGDSLNFFTDIDPWLTEPNIDAPISPPANVFKQVSGNDVTLVWDDNLESDLAGYKIHYGDYTGYSYENNIDVGNVTSYTLTGVNISTNISVTAYDNDIDGTNDQTEGHQSWFTQAYVTGCTDPTAINYDSYATINDGSCYHDILTDIDGNEYQAIQIGEQLWMKENLKVTHYNNGDPILTGFNNSEWANLSNVENWCLRCLR